LRAAGRVPAVLYGSQQEAVSLALDPKPVLAALHSDTGRNTILNLKVSGGESTSAVLQEASFDPVNGKLLHVDLRRIDLARKLRTKVPVYAVGEAKGVKVQGGILEFVTREVEVECLPMDIPQRIAADVTELVVGKNLRMRDLQLGDKVALISPPDQVVAHIVVMKEEVKPAEEAAVAAPAEPEVIKKGKAEKEEEGAEEGKEGKEAKEGKKK
jgi:large subunit ribosomal protein L25